MQVDMIAVLRGAMGAFSISVHELVPPYDTEFLIQPKPPEGINPLERFEAEFARAGEYLTKSETVDLKLKYGLCFLLVRHPDQDNALLVIGPWRYRSISQEESAANLRRYGETGAASLDNWVHSFPKPPAHWFEEVLRNMLDILIPEGKYQIRQIPEKKSSPFPEPEVFSDTLFWQSFSEGYLERRYEAENTLINAVANGDEHEALIALTAFMKHRLDDRFEGAPESCRHEAIIFNTLMRKSIERANVHPYHIDKISKRFADRIPSIITANDKIDLEREMVVEYARYVRTYALRNFSQPVKNTIQYINRNLDQDLSLAHLAKEGHISQSYLSNLFRKETGTTLTNYINQQRIYRASQLLKETEDSIAVIAESVGILDENYFSKMFRKTVGMTPSRYRMARRGMNR